MTQSSDQNIFSQVKNGMDQIIENKFKHHPFTYKITKTNVCNVMRNYTGMSEAFPFVQAGAIYELFLSSMAQNVSPGMATELTSVVAAFLISDELGVHDTVLQNGNKGLPKILDTKAQFHANLLKQDTSSIFGTVLPPDYTPTTKTYLHKLRTGLANPNSVVRAAAMTAFETHAHIMIFSLWNSLASIFNLNKESLGYFNRHVGGDDPAEAYHVEMTQKLITFIVAEDQVAEFLASFEEYYALNFNWCLDITTLQDEKLAA